jgi:hypothetical protein
VLRQEGIQRWWIGMVEFAELLDQSKKHRAPFAGGGIPI